MTDTKSRKYFKKISKCDVYEIANRTELHTAAILSDKLENQILL